ncbi:Making large colonies protein [Chlamydia abortus]|uniref:ROK family protein n=1 Tax=Paenibacillus residui TaxID=629724 RepID=A0ABW3D5S2_9BACL|nr:MULTISPECIES: ROK family protein [Paenibacillaceae]SHE13718.1 Making large colonies protein [Chlamydia abortus]
MAIKGPGLLREQNQKKLIHLLRKHKQTSRKDLAKLMGVSKNTISLIVDQFIHEGVIKEVGIKDSRRVGRPKILIELNADAFKSLGVTLSNESVDYVVTDYCLNIIDKGSDKVDSRQVGEVVACLTRLIQRTKQAHDGLIGVGIGIPGIVNTDEGIVYVSTKLEWKDVPLHSLLTQSAALPEHISLTIQNSVKMTALCASLTEELHHNPSFFYIRIGEGIAGAFFQHGQIWDGVSWTSGEIGHLPVEPAGPQCSCGQTGCLEQMISIRSYAQWMSEHEQAPAQEQMDDLLKQYGKYLGVALISVINIMNPGLIVIDSPYNSNAYFKQASLNYLAANALEIPLSKTKIEFNEQPYMQSLGAAVAVIHNYEH